MKHAPTQKEVVEAWRILRKRFNPEKAARLLGFTKCEMLAIEAVENPRRLKMGFEMRVTLVKQFIELTTSAHPLTGNQAARSLGKSHSWFHRWVTQLRRYGEKGLMTAFERKRATRSASVDLVD